MFLFWWGTLSKPRSSKKVEPVWKLRSVCMWTYELKSCVYLLLVGRCFLKKKLLLAFCHMDAFPYDASISCLYRQPCPQDLGPGFEHVITGEKGLRHVQRWPNSSWLLWCLTHHDLVFCRGKTKIYEVEQWSEEHWSLRSDFLMIQLYWTYSKLYKTT